MSYDMIAVACVLTFYDPKVLAIMTQTITLMKLDYYNAFNMGLLLKPAHKPLLVQNA